MVTPPSTASGPSAVDKFLHVRIVFFFLVKNPSAQPVEWLEIGLDTRGLIGLLSGIFTNKELSLTCRTLIAQQRFKDLLIKWVLELIVFDVPIHVGAACYIFVQLKVPTDEIGVGFSGQEAFYNVVHTLVFADKPQGFGGAAFFLAVRICWIAIPNQEAELL